MFGKKKKEIKNVTNKITITEEEMVCELLKEYKNQFGTNVMSSVKLYKSEDDFLLIEGDDKKFRIKDVQWAGVSTKTYNSLNTHAESSGNSKRTGRVLGAAVGTIIAPGIGTVIGAAHGTGNSKIKTDTKTEANLYEKTVEVPSSIMIKVKYENDIEECLQYKIMETQAQKLISYKSVEDKDAGDIIAKIKALKELLDIGAITQEEFTSKKKALLDKI